MWTRAGRRRRCRGRMDRTESENPCLTVTRGLLPARRALESNLAWRYSASYPASRPTRTSYFPLAPPTSFCPPKLVTSSCRPAFEKENLTCLCRNLHISQHPMHSIILKVTPLLVPRVPSVRALPHTQYTPLHSFSHQAPRLTAPATQYCRRAHETCSSSFSTPRAAVTLRHDATQWQRRPTQHQSE